MRWESACAWAPEKLIEWEGVGIKQIEGRMEDLGKWARKGCKGTRSS
jgi:hypothetical protein